MPPIAASLPTGADDVDIQRLSPLTLAYLGDSVWEQEVRLRLLWPPSKLNTLSNRVQGLVCAEGQFVVLQHLIDGQHLSDAELEWVRRGRNASPRGPRRLDPKVYRAATSLETLVGVLFLTNRSRLTEVLDVAFSSANFEAAPNTV